MKRSILMLAVSFTLLTGCGKDEPIDVITVYKEAPFVVGDDAVFKKGDVMYTAEGQASKVERLQGEENRKFISFIKYKSGKLIITDKVK